MAAGGRGAGLAIVLLVVAGLLSLAVMSSPDGRVCRVVIAARNSLTPDQVRELEDKDARLENCRWFVPKKLTPHKHR